MSPEDRERALFEAWLKQEFPRYEPRRLPPEHHRAGNYISVAMEDMWRAWLASKAALRARTL